MAPSLSTRRFGKQGLTVSELGLGCMGMIEFYAPTQQDEAGRAGLLSPPGTRNTRNRRAPSPNMDFHSCEFVPIRG